MRLIDIEPLQKERWHLHRYVAGVYAARVEEMELEEVPTVEAAPVKHGQWIKGGYACGETEYKCSACGETEWRTGCKRMKYCMYCGAKMDLEEQDADNI